MGHVMLGRLKREHDASSAYVLWGSDVIWDASQVKLYMLTIRDYRRQSNVPGRQANPTNYKADVTCIGAHMMLPYPYQTEWYSEKWAENWSFEWFWVTPMSGMKFGFRFYFEAQEFYWCCVLFAGNKSIFILFSEAILRKPHFVTCSSGSWSFGVVIRIYPFSAACMHYIVL
jgi:hypothetical protein